MNLLASVGGVLLVLVLNFIAGKSKEKPLNTSVLTEDRVNGASLRGQLNDGEVFGVGAMLGADERPF